MEQTDVCLCKVTSTSIRMLTHTDSLSVTLMHALNHQLLLVWTGFILEKEVTLLEMPSSLCRNTNIQLSIHISDSPLSIPVTAL